MTPIFQGRIERGKLILNDPTKYLLKLSSLEGKRVDLSVKQHRENRSDAQNRFYWAVVVKLLADHCGYTPEEMHDALKFRFLSDKCMDDKGLVKIRSTAALTTDEFIQYTNQVVTWAASDMGVFIPDPGQVEF